MADQECGNCRFYDGYDDAAGQCLRHPPRLAQTAEQQRESIAAHGPSDGLWAGWFPEVSAADWCGEWQAAKPLGPEG